MWCEIVSDWPDQKVDIYMRIYEDICIAYIWGCEIVSDRPDQKIGGPVLIPPSTGTVCPG